MTPTTVTPFVSACIALWAVAVLTSLVLQARKGAPERSERSEAPPDVLPPRASGGGVRYRGDCEKCDWYAVALDPSTVVDLWTDHLDTYHP